MSEAGSNRAEERERLAREVEREARETARYHGKEAFSLRVMEALRTVPRHLFVPPEDRALAYGNHPLPIGHGQTISQPYIVALMTDLLELGPDSRVLEIGTGCGYQAAMLAEVAGEVFTVEFVPELAERARVTLAELGYDNVEVRAADGYHGWPEHAPYDGIMITAAAPDVPEPLLEQLAPGGRLVLPLARGGWSQDLVVIEKREDGSIEERSVLPVAFVPFRRSS
jgi:protein-L-isoaspartate(D-aspartate) O-methyltransferase